MINTVSLSLDQAPPISIPFRFFLTAPLFAIGAGLELLILGDEMIATRWSPLTLGLTHLLTLGVLGMVMCGALLQMLPVIAGSPVPRVMLVGTLTHLLLILGTLLLTISFLSGSMVVTLAALTCLGICFGLFVIAVGIALWRLVAPGVTIRGMRLTLVALVVTVILGMAAALGYVGIAPVGHLSLITNIHLGWGLLGWVGLLLVSVSFQLVPMFQITPEYPSWVKRYLPSSVFIGLCAWLLLKLVPVKTAWSDAPALLAVALVVSGYILFSVTTLRLLSQRKRRVPDVTLLFWRLGMYALVLCALLWIGGALFLPPDAAHYVSMLLGIGLIQGVALSVINGMLYKIVPFLCWFHLQNRQMALMSMTVRVPHMKEFVTDRSAKRQFHLHLSGLVFTLAAAVAPIWFLRPAALLFILSNSLLLLNLAAAVQKYRATFKLLTPPAPGHTSGVGGTG